MITQEYFSKLKEDKLRREILLPLLQAMGFNDVYEYHGGAGEQGKDIVFWKEDELGNRENYALVVKAVDMSGQAKVEKGTAGEVQTQIRQCFGSNFIDPVSGETREVHRVWVVNNKRISKEAITAIRSAVNDPDIMRNVRFIDGDRLWALVEKHLPLSIWHYIDELREQTAAVDSHYEPHISIMGNETIITIVEKFPGAATEKPIIINARFAFPNEQTADDFHHEFQTHIETGKPLTIPDEFIQEIDFPDFFKSLVGVRGFSVENMQLLPVNSSWSLPVSIDFISDNGDIFALGYVLLKLRHGGTKELTL